MIINIGLLIIGFGFLIKGADLLVDGAASLARRLKVSDIVIGLTIVAFGTSTPELVVNIFAALRNTPEIAIGNILGSNIANILLILGLSSLIFPLMVTRNTVWKEIPLSLLAAVMVLVLTQDVLLDNNNYNILSRIDGIVLLAFFMIFMAYVFSIAKKDNDVVVDPALTSMHTGKAVGYTIAGLAILVVGGNIVVNNAIELAKIFGVSESLIGLTIVAVGTSLPELATSVVAAFKKNPDIAVGNVVGSNIFNIFFILGTSAVLRPLPFESGSTTDIFVAISASLLLFVFMFTGGRKRIDRWEGGIFVLAYVGYITWLILKG